MPDSRESISIEDVLDDDDRKQIDDAHEEANERERDQQEKDQDARQHTP